MARLMIININGWPGVGKLSVVERLRQGIGGRLLDNHTIFNVALSLCEFGTPEFFEMVRAVRKIAFTAVTNLPLSIPVVLTSAYANTPFGRENWTAIRDMANARASPLCNIVLDCSLDENLRRLQAPGRAALRKLTDPEPLIRSRQNAELLADGGDYLLRCDATELTPEEAACRIEDWLGNLGLLPNR